MKSIGALLVLVALTAANVAAEPAPAFRGLRDDDLISLVGGVVQREVDPTPLVGYAYWGAPQFRVESVTTGHVIYGLGSNRIAVTRVPGRHYPEGQVLYDSEVVVLLGSEDFETVLGVTKSLLAFRTLTPEEKPLVQDALRQRAERKQRAVQGVFSSIELRRLEGEEKRVAEIEGRMKAALQSMNLDPDAVEIPIRKVEVTEPSCSNIMSASRDAAIDSLKNAISGLNSAIERKDGVHAAACAATLLFHRMFALSDQPERGRRMEWVGSVSGSLANAQPCSEAVSPGTVGIAALCQFGDPSDRDAQELWVVFASRLTECGAGVAPWKDVALCRGLRRRLVAFMSKLPEAEIPSSIRTTLGWLKEDRASGFGIRGRTGGGSASETYFAAKDAFEKAQRTREAGDESRALEQLAQALEILAGNRSDSRAEGLMSQIEETLTAAVTEARADLARKRQAGQ